MSRSATLPPIRVAPETKACLEAVLREGESLTQFIEGAVCREAEFRAEQNAAMARAKVALRSAAKGVGLLTAEDFLAGMTQRAHADWRGPSLALNCHRGAASVGDEIDSKVVGTRGDLHHPPQRGEDFSASLIDPSTTSVPFERNRGQLGLHPAAHTI